MLNESSFYWVFSLMAGGLIAWGLWAWGHHGKP